MSEDLRMLRDASQVDSGKQGYTAAGRALQKHGDRAGSKFPKIEGGSKNANPAAKKIVEEILGNPRSVTKSNQLGGVDVIGPNGLGIRYYGNGRFRGFLEPGPWFVPPPPG